MSTRVSIGDVHIRREDSHLETFKEVVTYARAITLRRPLKVYAASLDDELLLELCAQWLAMSFPADVLPGRIFVRSEEGPWWEAVHEDEMIDRAHTWAEAD